MRCETTRTELSRCENASDPRIAGHLAECSACTAFAKRLQSLESRVRAFPTPRAASVSRDRFIEQLNGVKRPTDKKPRRDRVPGYAWVIAASFLILVSFITFLTTNQHSNKPVVAQTRVIDDVVEFNLALAETENPSDRRTMVNQRGPALRRAANTLAGDERGAALKLLDSADALAVSNHPLDDAENIHDLADTLSVLLSASTSESEPRLEAMAKLYMKLDEKVEAKLAKVVRDKSTEIRLKDLNVKQQKQAARVEALAQKLPESARRQIANKKKQSK